jgi:hypothetical protein
MRKKLQPKRKDSYAVDGQKGYQSAGYLPVAGKGGIYAFYPTDG